MTPFKEISAILGQTLYDNEFLGIYIYTIYAYIRLGFIEVQILVHPTV